MRCRELWLPSKSELFSAQASRQARASRAVQGMGELDGSASEIRESAEAGTRGPAVPLPHLDAIQRSFGRHSVKNVQAHLGADAQQASLSMSARAYAYGTHVAFARQPDVFTAAHEAAHVVQQLHGIAPSGGIGHEGDAHERLADEVATRAAQGQSAESLLDKSLGSGAATLSAAAPPAVQRLTLRLGDREQQGFLDDEQWGITSVHRNETVHSIPDKWGDQGEYSRNPIKKWKARKHGNEEVGPRKSFMPQSSAQMYLGHLRRTEDLRIIAHGSGSSDRVAGYTPTKFVRLLMNLGLPPSYVGNIYLHACVTAQPRRDGGTVLEDIYNELRRIGYRCEVFGLRGAIIGGGRDETPLATYRAEHALEAATNEVTKQDDALAKVSNYMHNGNGWVKPAVWYREYQLRQAQNTQAQRQNQLNTMTLQQGGRGQRNWIQASALVQARQRPRDQSFWRWIFRNPQQVAS